MGKLLLLAVLLAAPPPPAKPVYGATAAKPAPAKVEAKPVYGSTKAPAPAKPTRPSYDRAAGQAQAESESARNLRPTPTVSRGAKGAGAAGPVSPKGVVPPARNTGPAARSVTTDTAVPAGTAGRAADEAVTPATAAPPSPPSRGGWRWGQEGPLTTVNPIAPPPSARRPRYNDYDAPPVVGAVVPRVPRTDLDAAGSRIRGTVAFEGLAILMILALAAVGVYFVFFHEIDVKDRR